MSDSATIAGDIHSNPKLLRCGLLARYLFQAMIVGTDHEGRGLTDPLHWQQQASLWGPAAVSLEDLAGAIRDLETHRLIVRYGEVGKLLFLPGRFEHNPGRTYWKKSKLPLPVHSVLKSYPQYAAGLAALCTDGRLRGPEDTTHPRRYPALRDCYLVSEDDVRSTDAKSCENLRKSVKACETVRENAKSCADWAEVEVEVEVEVEEKEGEARARAEPPPQKLATKEQKTMIEQMALERGYNLSMAVSAAMCRMPLRASDVSAVKTWLLLQPRRTPAELETDRKNKEVNTAWQKMRKFIHDPGKVTRYLTATREKNQPLAWALMQRLGTWLAEQGGTDQAMTWRSLEALPSAYTAAGVGSRGLSPKGGSYATAS